ncbi:MAG: electron transfer flavoprotein subunit beta/FixA family protein [Desulfarculus sp.]|nr:electron transfer flavoprotein subunit beta/FixA family protein [Desulfarculus sp.]
MNIVVCIKQVPDTESQIKIGADGKSIATDDIKWVMNPYDEFGVEEALRIQKAKGGTVTVVGAGPKRVTEALRTALAMGADKAVLVEDEGLYGADPMAVAKILAAAIKPLTPDLVFLGQRAIDDDAGLVGSALAEYLDMPNLSVVTKLDLGEGSLTAQRPVEGQTLVLEAPLPAVVTAQKGLNEPRYASLPGIMKAKKKPLEVKTLADLGVDAAGKASVVALNPPPSRAAGKTISGETPQELAAALAKALRDEAKVI